METGNKNQTSKKQFISIEKKISARFGQIVSFCCIILGIIASILSYISSISAVSESIDETSKVAADYVSASLGQYIAIASETGSLARLADPENTTEEKSAILNHKIQKYHFDSGFLLDGNGIDIISGEDLSDRDYFKEAMKGNTYVSTPAYSNVTHQVSFAIAAPLWENGIPDTTPVGVVVYVPDGECLNDIMRSIQVGKGGTAFITDDKGITIADINSEIVGVENTVALGDTDPKLKKFSEICKKMVAGEDGTGTYTYGGVTKVVAYSPVPYTPGWSIGIAAVRNEFLGKFYLALALTAFFVIAFTIFGVMNGIQLGKAVARPIITSVDRLKLLAEGDFHSDVPSPETNDETAILMNCLAETIQDLQTVVSEISSHLAELADGNFKLTIEETYKGDFSLISDSFRDIISSLSCAMQEIDSNAENVQNGSLELAKASQLLAEGATNQANAIEELTATITAVEESTQHVKSAAESFIADAANQKEVSEFITGITEASGCQAETVEQAALGITRIAEVIESNSAISQECAAASEELAVQADLLKELVGRFQYFKQSE